MVLDFFQGIEPLLLFLIVLLIFGPTKLPQLARGLGQAIYEFRRASQGLTEEEKKQVKSRKELESIDEETLKKLAEKLGVDSKNKDKEQLITEIMAEAKKKGLIDEVKVEAKN